ncbi:PID-CTERM protein-sorting domain-containing protein [Ferruginibacter albus]|uniref:PID-CTERM protein-sorting domain-containing protein n=1 Tax=Ferruginibacter albus TaxID=2875540 RepID=UPI001CC3D93B|nr:hypothetical protein [Ferruginibacter albus]UAY50708.1 hypothetical protein K9M53_08880 [Ferruginibacter albus]
MKRNSKFILLAIAMFVFFNMMPAKGHAQDAVGDLDPQGDVDAPIDGGISILLAAGISYGLAKRKADKTENENSAL